MELGSRVDKDLGNLSAEQIGSEISKFLFVLKTYFKMTFLSLTWYLADRTNLVLESNLKNKRNYRVFFKSTSTTMSFNFQWKTFSFQIQKVTKMVIMQKMNMKLNKILFISQEKSLSCSIQCASGCGKRKVWKKKFLLKVFTTYLTRALLYHHHWDSHKKHVIIIMNRLKKPNGTLNLYTLSLHTIITCIWNRKVEAFSL